MPDHVLETGDVAAREEADYPDWTLVSAHVGTFPAAPALPKPAPDKPSGEAPGNQAAT